MLTCKLCAQTPVSCRRSSSSTNTTGNTVPSGFPLKPPFHHTAKLRVLMDSPALGKAELVAGGCASWALARASAGKCLRRSKKTAQRTAREPCAASLAASHVHSYCAAPAAGTPLAHTRLQGMLTGAPVLCIWGVILDLSLEWCRPVVVVWLWEASRLTKARSRA